jgi:hypothetical protein
MSSIYSTDAFDAEAFEKEAAKSFDAIDRHVVRGLTDNFTNDMESGMVSETTEGGWVEMILGDLYIRTDNPEDEKIRESLYRLFSYLSENEGRLTEEFGISGDADNPLFFYGYLKPDEVKELHSLLLNLPADIDQGFLEEFKERIIGICDVCEKKTLGLIFYSSP